jgi:hypothetical protein
LAPVSVGKFPVLSNALTDWLAAVPILGKCRGQKSAPTKALYHRETKLWGMKIRQSVGDGELPTAQLTWPRRGSPVPRP